MNGLKHFFFLSFTFLLSYSFSQTSQTNLFQTLIVGSWHGNDIDINGDDVRDTNYQFVFEDTGRAYEILNGNIEYEYNWSIISESTPSGLVSSTLILHNLNDPDLSAEFEIDTLTQSHMTLVYNNGIGLDRNYFLRE